MVTGSAAGVTPVAIEVVGHVGGPANDAGDGFSYAGASIANTTGTCELLRTRYHNAALPYVPNAASLFVEIDAAPGTPIAPGTYPITVPFNHPAPGAPNVFAGYFALDASCRSTATEFATQGTITLTLVTAHTVEGSFNLTAFSSPTNDQVTGTFTAPVCQYDAISSGVDGGFSLDAGDGDSHCPP
jgi:hypothetical protein